MINFQEVATGYIFPEAPRADGNTVWFSDPIRGGIYRVSEEGEVESFLPDLFRVGGMCLNSDGTIICSARGGIAWARPEQSEWGMLVDEIDGEAFLGGNDIFPDGKGGLYFGTVGLPPENATEPAKLTALYHLDTSYKVTMLWDNLHVPNGIGLSPDRKRLYVNETWRGTFVYKIEPDGTLSTRELFYPQLDCDGLAVDAEGGVWVACNESGMIIRLLPDGILDCKVTCPAKNVTSLCFTGVSNEEIFITTGGDQNLRLLMRCEEPRTDASVFRGKSEIRGLDVPVTDFTI